MKVILKYPFDDIKNSLDSITELYCVNCRLIELPELPESLRSYDFVFDDNKIINKKIINTNI